MGKGCEILVILFHTLIVGPFIPADACPLLGLPAHLELVVGLIMVLSGLDSYNYERRFSLPAAWLVTE